MDVGRRTKIEVQPLRGANGKDIPGNAGSIRSGIPIDVRESGVVPMGVEVDGSGPGIKDSELDPLVFFYPYQGIAQGKGKRSAVEEEYIGLAFC